MAKCLNSLHQFLGTFYNPPMLPETDDLSLLAIHLSSRFVLDDNGRILSEGVPDRRTGPRLHLEGSVAGNLLSLRRDVAEETARKIQLLAAREPPFLDPEREPVHGEEYRQLLAVDAPVIRSGVGLLWTFPDNFTYEHDKFLVCSGTPEGERLLADIRTHGMLMPLVEMGYFHLEDLWEPWCLALHDGAIASIAITSRIGPNSAEPGVGTVRALRGRGYAAAATAGWAALPALRGRTLFYSTQHANHSSRRVAQRLGLRYLGASFSIA